MKIIAIGMNYAAHNNELHFSTPTEPTLFMKADTSLLREGMPFFIPDFSKNLHYEAEVVIKINRLGKNISEKFAYRYYNDITIGIDFTARDLQERLRKAGLPWEISKAFDNSAVVGHFISKSEINLNSLDFHLDINGNTVQKGNTKDMLFSIDQIVAYASRFFTLKMGDLIFTGTPSGVGSVHIGDCLEGYLNSQKLLSLNIK